MSIFGDPSADVVVSQQAWIAITAEAEKLAAMAKECAAERQALRAEVERPTTSKRWVTRPAALPFPRRTWVVTTFGAGTGYLHTPTATANYACASMQKWKNCREFVRVLGKPTPENHEWLMTWPRGWTALQPLGTDRWRSWRQRLGG